MPPGLAGRFFTTRATWEALIQMNLFTKQKQTHRENKFMVIQREREERDKLGVRELIDTHNYI